MQREQDETVIRSNNTPDLSVELFVDLLQLRSTVIRYLCLGVVVIELNIEQECLSPVSQIFHIPVIVSIGLI